MVRRCGGVVGVGRGGGRGTGRGGGGGGGGRGGGGGEEGEEEEGGEGEGDRDKYSVLSDVPRRFDGGPTVVVLGSEGAGIRTLVKRQCDGFIWIPGGETDDDDGEHNAEGEKVGRLDSLNVAVTAGIVVNYFMGN